MNLVEQWLSLVDEEDILPELEADQRNRALEAVTLQALADGGEGRQEVLTAFRTTGNATLRERLEQIVLPPSTLAVYEPDEYRTHPEVRFDESRMPIRVALGLPVADMLKAEPGFQQDPFKWTASWFAGRPAVARATANKWSVPRRADGTALTHIVQVDLETEAGNQGSDIYPATGLPSTGVIQFFHDLETYGDSSDDPTAWRVVWLPESIDELTLADVGLFADVTELVPINAQVMATAPSVLNVDGLSEDEGDRYQRASDWLDYAPYFMNPMSADATNQEAANARNTPWDELPKIPQPISRMGGYGYPEFNQDFQDILDERLPVTGDDSHVLLFDINPGQIGTPIDWFHGHRHAEVCIRHSDLQALNFADVWAFIRTDA